MFLRGFPCIFSAANFALSHIKHPEVLFVLYKKNTFSGFTLFQTLTKTDFKNHAVVLKSFIKPSS